MIKKIIRRLGAVFLFFVTYSGIKYDLDVYGRITSDTGNFIGLIFLFFIFLMKITEKKSKKKLENITKEKAEESNNNLEFETYQNDKDKNSYEVNSPINDRENFIIRFFKRKVNKNFLSKS